MAGGTAFANRVERILTRAGENFGSGKLTGTLRRVTQRRGPGYFPTGETSGEWTFVGLLDSFTTEERASGLVQDGDLKLLIAPTSIDTVPVSGDKVVLSGTEYRVKNVDIVRPASVDLLYTLTMNV